MENLKEVVHRVLLPLQLSLGIFQIMKTTPLWAVIHCTLASLLNFFRFPYTDYKQLRGFEGRVFKKVISHATTAGDVSKLKKHKDAKESKKEVKFEIAGPVDLYYLGKMFQLKKDGNTMLVNDGPAYFITDKMWETVKYIGKVAADSVFVKNYKEIWEEVVTGDIMEFEEVLDSVILDNRAVVRLDHDYFLPVNLLMSEDKLQRTLNFMGVFLQTQKHVHWFIPACLSFTAASMGFSTTLRLSIVGWITKILCKGVQLLCDILPLAMRRRVYFWGSWVENLKPGNDLQSKIVRGTVDALIAGGAKIDSESLADYESLDDKDPIRVLVGGCARTHLEIADCESLAELVIFADQNNRYARLTGGAKAKVQLGLLAESESLANPSVGLVQEICPKAGPFVFKCESKSDLKCNSKRYSVYIEWIFDNTNQICSLKAGRLASQEPLEARDIYIVSDHGDDDCRWVEDIKLFTFASYCGKEEHNKSLIANDFDTTSVDVECSSKEAIKLLKFAYYMAKNKSGSLKSYDRNTNTVYVRRFVESINAYVRSRYPPLYKLNKLEHVVVC